MGTKQKNKRPASHICAIVVYIVVILSNYIFNASGYDLKKSVLVLSSIAALVSSLVVSRSKFSYFLGLIALFYMFFQSIHQVVLSVKYFTKGSMLIRPIENVTFSAVYIVLALLLIKLLWSYTFGAASRQYYSFNPNN